MPARIAPLVPIAKVAAALAIALVAPSAVADGPPAVAREFRGAWVATVANIDWPTKPGLAVAEQKAELVALLDKARELRLNAVVFQVRPACDAMYASDLEPWSEFLTGKEGQAPADDFDPLTFACDEAHARGIELHAWLNPYRASHPQGTGKRAATHVASKRPDLVRKYGVYDWLDPGEPDAAQHSLDVLLDIVRRYDVDAVHFDDYFYPYPITALGEDGVDRPVPFPDDPSWKKYCDATPEPDRLSRDDWRRDNVNRFLKRVSEETHKLKPHVRFGVSPFGIYRPGTPPSIKGFDPYESLYADSKLWLAEGWVDYFSPQLYWPIDQTAQSYTTLLDWWGTQNPKGRNLWPGLFTSKVGDEAPAWKADEIVNQVLEARKRGGASGHIHFSMKAVAGDYGGVAKALTKAYAEPALVPASPWLAGEAPSPAAPRVTPGEEPRSFSLEAASGETPALWVVQKHCGDAWVTTIVEGRLNGVNVRPDAAGKPADRLAVIAIDRFGRQSAPTVVEVK
ncbi:MAG: glycoside hydrolase family 10 protein [Lacipirellulaceae bacterium]